ncbi:MAG TPA: hypothetical protein GXX75_09390 [Clostridiales bacterium]|nr:hypothetical protein [Clostridiales bacterium]
MAIDDSEVVKVTDFQHERNIAELHRRVLAYNRVLFFIPYKGRGISAYHLDTGQMEFFLPSDRKEIHASDAFIHKETIWILPRVLDQPLYEFNITHKRFYKYEEWNNRLLKLLNITDKHILSLSATCFLDRIMWTVIYNTPYVIRTELMSGNVDIYYLSDELRLRGIAYDEGKHWLTMEKGGDLLYIDFLAGNAEIFHIDTSNDASFMNLIIDEKSVLVLPCRNSNIYKIDKRQQTVSVIKDNLKQNEIKKSLPLYMGWIKGDNGLLILPSAGDNILKCTAEYEPKLKILPQKLKCEGSVFYERNNDFFMNYIENIDTLTSILEPHLDSETFGAVIWRYIKNNSGSI